MRGDVTYPAALETALMPRVNTVFHLAAVVGVENYLYDPLRIFDVNVTGTRNFLALSPRHGARVVMASTSEVFGRNPNAVAEDGDCVLGSTRPARWSYSTSKAIAEHLAFAMYTTYGLPVTVVRYFNVYGSRQHDRDNGGRSCRTCNQDCKSRRSVAGRKPLIPQPIMWPV